MTDTSTRRFVCDREAVAAWLDRPLITVRKHVPVIGYDADGRALCDLETAAAILATVPCRPRRGEAVGAMR